MNDNTIWSVGSNDYGALGLGDTTQRTTFTQVTNLPSGNIKEISGNSGYRSDFYFNDNSFILLDDGSLYGCGRNAVGELGIGDNISRNTFTQIPLPI
jgi:alpha-tubulin suppressor-like RCC1 family protein